jgi:hypothetical protein
VNHITKLNNVPRLIALQMPYHMPSYDIADFPELQLGFLDVILTDISHSASNGLSYFRQTAGLRDHDKVNILTDPPGCPSRSVYALPYGAQVVSNN